MSKAMDETYSNAGILKKAGKGLRMDIAGAEFFLIDEDLRALMSNQMADVVNQIGEREGLAWLSPIVAQKKIDLTTVIHRHIYVVSYEGFGRVINGKKRHTVIKEYHQHRLATKNPNFN